MDNYTVLYSGGDRHARGVGMLIDQTTAKSILGYWQISDRVMLIKLKGQPFNISVIQVYAPTSEANENEIEDFYEKLDAAKTLCKSQEVVIVMGDFNAKIGEGAEVHCEVGQFGLGDRNSRGDMLADFCRVNELDLTNTMLNHHPRRRYIRVYTYMDLAK